MQIHRIPASKINSLRKLFLNNNKFNKVQAAVDLNLTRNTVQKYVAEFRRIQADRPEKIRNKDFFMPVGIAEHRATEKHVEMIKFIPAILEQMKGKDLTAKATYACYAVLCPDGYAYSTFKDNFFSWCESNQVSRQRNYVFPEADLVILNQWRRGNDHQRWQVAVALLQSADRNFTMAIAKKVEVCKDTVLIWLRTYKKEGLEGFKRTHVLNDAWLQEIKEREDNLIHLLHQTPKIYGINRTSWKLEDLAAVYERVHEMKISATMVSRALRKRGYRMLKSKEVLTSPDPLFREKYSAIQEILANLGEKEKFFSIDEYGPFSLKIKGGRTFVKKGEYPSYPQRQTSKGWLICTAALELSTNQITHFYSLKKNTAEMIKLLDVLVLQYHDQDRLFLSWDKASWHASAMLNAHVDLLNSAAHRTVHHNPLVCLAPLPASSQFLNVIESVFSGLAKAVIHHSNYKSVLECQTAINLHFQTRNEHFLEHPKRAGNRIWGKELVKPVFDKANRCKTSNSLSTKQ